jgi:hypothetical protein
MGYNIDHLKNKTVGFKNKADVIVKVDGYLFPVHSLILAKDSPLLEDMLQIALDESSEDEGKRVAVEGFNASTLPVVVLKEAGSQVPFTLETLKKMLSSQYSLGTLDMSIYGYRDLEKMALWLVNDY